MKPLSLDMVYADPLAKIALQGAEEAEHRRLVRRGLAPGEPILAFWWDKGVTGLLLATDRRLIQFPRFENRKLLFGYTVSFETWSYFYADIRGISGAPGGFFQFSRMFLHRASKEDSTIVLTGLNKDEVEARISELQQVITYCRSHQVQHEELTPEDLTGGEGELAEQVKRLYDLYREGILDHEEFTAAKKKLLTGTAADGAPEG